jgi:hypothetical protein
MGAPYTDWMKKVNQRNAPGAISAIAFTVSPVSPNVARDVLAEVTALGISLDAIVDHLLLSTVLGSLYWDIRDQVYQARDSERMSTR